MGSLANLFTTYKTLEESADDFNNFRTSQNKLSGAPEIKSRLQSFIETNRKSQNYEKPLETGNSEGFSEISEKGDDSIFKHWFGNFYDNLFENNTPFKTNVKAYSRGKLDEEIKKLFSEEGINIIVTSGKRAAGAAGKAGNRSHHVHGNAADIVPGKGETFNSIKLKMQNSPRIQQFFTENGLGVINETEPETMKQTGATGKHLHIGPDQLATQTWRAWNTQNNKKTEDERRKEWTITTRNAYFNGLKEKYGNQYSDSYYDRISKYMTYQSAIESGYGLHAKNYNYGGHKVNGQTVKYNSLPEFVRAHLKTLDKWDYMKSQNLNQYVDSLYRGPYKYNTSQTAKEYFNSIRGSVNRVNGYLANVKRLGGILGILKK